FYVSLYVKANKVDKRPIAALLAVFAVSVMFWAVFKQNGTALTRWAQYYTERQVPASVEKPLSDLYLVEEKSFETKEVTQYDEQFRAIRDTDGNVQKAEGKDVYFRNLAPEKVPQDG